MSQQYKPTPTFKTSQICDHLCLQRSTLHGFLGDFADPREMVFSRVATLVHAPDAERQSYIEVLEERLRGFINLMIEPRIANYRSDVPLVTAAISEQTLQVVKDSVRLSYLFELMQQKRQVPLARYSLDQVPPPIVLTMSPSSLLEVHGTIRPVFIEQEYAHNDADQLYKENRHLWARVNALQQDMKYLQHTNGSLMHKLILLGHPEPA
ncbi:hypothetical protein DE146DRAFT_635469 [Phaeosphaeria sp. MPI-PUGE-AT-0046c]|nr:hypothetical protein DE146DRAFT_635469 [Phaeosphaeria sp. MPI-PUGE-AT-0046c]